MRLAGLLATLPVLATAVPTIIPIAVDQNLSESTLDLSPDQLDSAGSDDWLAGDELFTSPSNPNNYPAAQDVAPPHVEAPKPSAGLAAPGSKANGGGPSLAGPTAKQACGLAEHKQCPSGQMCARPGNDQNVAGLCRAIRPNGPAHAKNFKAGSNTVKSADVDMYKAIAAAALQREREQR